MTNTGYRRLLIFKYSKVAVNIILNGRENVTGSSEMFVSIRLHGYRFHKLISFTVISKELQKEWLPYSTGELSFGNGEPHLTFTLTTQSFMITAGRNWIPNLQFSSNFSYFHSFYLLAILQHCKYLHYMASTCRMTDEWMIEVRRTGKEEVTASFRHYPGRFLKGLRGDNAKHHSNNWCPCQELNWTPPE